MAFAPQRENPGNQQRSLLERGWDFGFGSFFPGGLFGGLPGQAAVIVESIWNTRGPTSISEVPQTWEELEELDPELFEPILETRPGLPPDAYPGSPAATGGTVVALPPPEQLPDQPDDEENEMSHDWGHLAREFLGGVGSQILGQNAASYANTQGSAELLPGSTAAQLATIAATGGGGVGDGCDGMVWSGGVPPKGYKVVNSCGVGVLRKVRRRRRKRMLTVSDKNDIASIISMVGKGQLAATLMNRGG